MKAQSRFFFLIALALILSATGCASSTSKPSLPTPGIATSDFPTGVFLWQGEDPLGGHRVEYKTDGSYVYSGHGRGTTGKYTVTGDQIVFIDSYCGGKQGLYSWAFSGETLTFELLEDNCADRSGVLGNSAWKERP